MKRKEEKWRWRNWNRGEDGKGDRKRGRRGVEIERKGCREHGQNVTYYRMPFEL